MLAEDLVFHHAEDLSCGNDNRISNLAADLVFQEVPRKSLQSRWRRQRRRRWQPRELHGLPSPCRGGRLGRRLLRRGLCRCSLRQPPMVRVLRVPRAPWRLRAGAALPL